MQVITLGIAGPQGPPGPLGPQGIQGIQGIQGLPGDLTPVSVWTTANGPVSPGTVDIPRTFHWTLSGDLTVTVGADPRPDVSGTITMVLKQSASGGPFTVTWPVDLPWAGGALAPAMPTAANSKLVVHLFWTGQEWLGSVMGTFF